MFTHLIQKMFGSQNDRVVKKLIGEVDSINALEADFAKLDDNQLREKSDFLKQQVISGTPVKQLRAESFALVREASKRVLGMRHFDVQLIGAMALDEGYIAEMKTGEGKTLVSTLAGYLNALSGKGVHLVTVNDYLAKRDGQWMGGVYRFLGMNIGIILPQMSPDERREAYQADITYGTNNEFGFDYLRDNLRLSLDHMVQRDYHYAIIDEVDSILIDEARTPLIISGPSDASSENYKIIDKIIPKLDSKDYDLDEKNRTISLSEKGQEHVEALLKKHTRLLQTTSLYDSANVSIVHHVDQALRAHKLFERDVHYIVRNNKLIIIDEFTGRMMEGRRFSDGLHQALEAKENVTIQKENQTLASITFQNYFRMYPKLAGMT
ncbi:MAG: preprotein translocase subunit SecA, partial [Pseudomonadota bacterium]